MPERTLSDGSVVKGETPEQMLDVAIKMKEDTSSALRQAREEMQRMQEQMQVLQQNYETVQSKQRQYDQPKPTNPNGFNNDQYYRLMNEDPIRAQNYIDAHRFGLQNPDQVPQYIQSMAQDVSAVKQQMLSTAFYQRHQDFDPQYADALTNKFGELINAGHPADIRTLEIGYRELMDSGKAKPLASKPDKDEDKPTPPPSLSGSGADALTADEEARLNAMSMEELEKELRRRGALK